MSSGGMWPRGGGGRWGEDPVSAPQRTLHPRKGLTFCEERPYQGGEVLQTPADALAGFRPGTLEPNSPDTQISILAPPPEGGGALLPARLARLPAPRTCCLIRRGGKRQGPRLPARQGVQFSHVCRGRGVGHQADGARGRRAACPVPRRLQRPSTVRLLSLLPPLGTGCLGDRRQQQRGGR